MTTRLIFDADSHTMEPSDWLHDYVDSRVRRELLTLPYPFEFSTATADRLRAERAADAEKAQRARDRTFAMAFQAYGAWDRVERSRVLDDLGFSAQLVFATIAADIAHALQGEDGWAAIRGLNRGLVEFCSSDPRLLPVAYVPLTDGELAVAEAERALAEGAACVHVTTHGRTKSPTHPDFEGLWARLAEARVPVVCHIGGGGSLIPNQYTDNGRPAPPVLFQGGEPLTVRSYVGISYWPEYFLSAMAIDGVFARHPDLRCGVIEQGAEWLVTLLRRLDHAAEQFGKRDPLLLDLAERPADYVRRQVKVTPFYSDDVAWIVDEVGTEMLMFSSDYPHVEGGRNPVGRFDAALAGASDDTRDRFYAQNFVELMGSVMDRVPSPVGG